MISFYPFTQGQVDGSFVLIRDLTDGFLLFLFLCSSVQLFQELCLKRLFSLLKWWLFHGSDFPSLYCSSSCRSPYNNNSPSEVSLVSISWRKIPISTLTALVRILSPGRRTLRVSASGSVFISQFISLIWSDYHTFFSSLSRLSFSSRSRRKRRDQFLSLGFGLSARPPARLFTWNKSVFDSNNHRIGWILTSACWKAVNEWYIWSVMKW